jgi:hypothetical protein
MHKHWIAMLSIAGLAGSTVPAGSQPLDDTKATSATKTNATGKTGKSTKAGGKLTVKQETVRNQNQTSSAAKPKRQNAQTTKGQKPALTKGKNEALTKGQKPALTK